MVWYYAEGDRQKGPLSDEEFQDLVNIGRINSETLVWKDGMDNWQPLENTREAGLVKISPALPPLSGSHSVSLPQNTIGLNNDLDSVMSESVNPSCAQCGRNPTGEHDGIKLGNLLLCRNCDADLARHYQSAGQLVNGVPVDAYKDASGFTSLSGTVALPYASIISRAAAKIIDNLVESVVLLVIVALTTDLELLTTAVQNFRESPEHLLTALRPFMLGTLVFRVLYDGVLIGKFGATLGKMALRVRVVAQNGSQVRFSQAVIRAIAPAILQLPGMMLPESSIAQVAQFLFLFGYLIAIFDVQKRTIYDHVAGTRVVSQ